MIYDLMIWLISYKIVVLLKHFVRWVQVEFQLILKTLVLSMKAKKKSRILI